MSNDLTSVARWSYFSLFLGKGSIYPFLGILLRTRGCSLLTLALAMNFASVARLVAAYLLSSVVVDEEARDASSADHDSGHGHNQDRAARRADQSKKSHDRLFRLLNIFVAVAMLSGWTFALAPGLAAVSAVAVAALTASLAVTSLVLDVLVVDTLAKQHQQQQQQQENGHDDDGESSNTIVDSGDSASGDADIIAASGFGELRLFGSIGWGIGSPLQVAVVSVLLVVSDSTNNNNKSPSSNDGVVSSSLAQAMNGPNAFYITPLVFFISLTGFVVALRKLQKRFGGGEEEMTATTTVMMVEKKQGGHNNDGEEPEDSQKSVVENIVTVINNKSNDDDTSKQRLTHHADVDEAAVSATEVMMPVSELLWHLRYALLLALIYGICDSVVSTFLFPFVREQHKGSTALVGWIPTVNVLSELPVLYASRWLHENISVRSLHLAFLSLWVVRLIFYVTTAVHNDARWVFLVEVLNGFCYGGAFVLCVRNVVLVSLEKGVALQRAVPWVHSTFLGVSGVVTGVIGGVVADAFGVPAVFLSAAGMCVCGWVLVALRCV